LLGSVVAAHAGVITVKYSLSAHTRIGDKVPANTPVQLIGDQAIFGDIGVAPLVLHNVPGEGLQSAGVSWFDFNSVNNFSGSTGTCIVALDYDGDVILEVRAITPKNGPDSYGFFIANTGDSTVAGHVKLTANTRSPRV
jgi:hypothetical protein